MDALTVIRDESQRFAQVLAGADPVATVPTCPDWSAADLLWHLTEVHLFWAGILGNDVRAEEGVGAVEASKPDRPATIAELLPLREQATAALLEQLDQLDDAAPRWSWWESDQTVGFTRRMQTHEATMHRVDAELTAGLPISSIAPDVAGAAVDHCVDVMWGWLPEWGTHHPLALVRFEASDTGGDWLVEIGHWTGIGPDSGQALDWPRAVRATSGTPTGTVRAPAQDLALWAWTRGGAVDIQGDDTTRAAVDRLIQQGIQ